MPLDEFAAWRTQDTVVVDRQFENELEVSGWTIRWTGSRISRCSDDAITCLVLGAIDEVRGGAGRAGEPAVLLLDQWRRHGPRAVGRCIGPWVALVVDRSTGGIAVARDLAAGEAVFVSRTPGVGPVVGSDLGSVARATGAFSRPDPLFLASYLQGAFLDPACTPFEGVSVVAPGHAAHHRAHGWTQTRQAHWQVSTFRPRDLDAAADAVGATLDQAVADRVGSAQRVAVALSGGIDSTNVAASLRRVRPDIDIRALSIPFFAQQGDERALQAEVAAHVRAELSWVDVSHGGPVTGFGDSLLTGRGWPPRSGNWFFNQALAQRADDLDADVIFDGEDADSAFGGNLAYLPDMVARGQWRSWWRQARGFDGSSLRSVAKFSMTSLLPPALDWRASGQPASSVVSPLIAPQLAAGTAFQQRLDAQPSLHVWSPGRRFRAGQLLAGDPAVMSVVAMEADAGSTGLSVRPAHPFQDRRVRELAMALPWWACIHDGHPKAALRRLAARSLPAGFLTTSKKADLGEYYTASVTGRERGMVSRGLSLAAKNDGVFAARAVAQLIDDFARGDQVWQAARVAVLALWLDSLPQLR